MLDIIEFFFAFGFICMKTKNAQKIIWASYRWKIKHTEDHDNETETQLKGNKFMRMWKWQPAKRTEDFTIN